MNKLTLEDIADTKCLLQEIIEAYAQQEIDNCGYKVGSQVMFLDMKCWITEFQIGDADYKVYVSLNRINKNGTMGKTRAVSYDVSIDNISKVVEDV